MRIGFWKWGHRVVGVGFAAMIAAGCASAQVASPPPPPSAPPVAEVSAPWPDAARARAVVDTLASDAFAGRGYDAAQGAARAATWTAARLAATPGVRPVGAAFVQPFALDADVVEQAGVAVGGRRLVLGADVLPMAEAASGRVSGPTCAAASVVPGCVLVLDAAADVRARLVDAARQGATAAVVLSDALPPYGPTGAALPLPVVTARRAAWPADARTVRVDLVRGAARQTGGNVVATVPGTAVPDSFVVVTAHLDHLGRIDDTFGGKPAVFRGANDNASGVAAVLALADTLARRPLRYTTVVVLTGGEEQGLVGAFALAARPSWPLDRTRLLVNLDMVASGETGIGVFGAAEQPDVFAGMQADAARLALGPLTGRAMRPNSDQYPFHEAGVPAVYLLTLGGRQPYHSTGDVPATLDWDDWARVVALAHATLRRATGER